MARFRLTSDKIQLSENDVEKACIELLRWKHYYPLRLHSGLFIPAEREVIRTLRQAGVRFRVVTIGEPGIPDYCIPKCFIEVKRPGGKLSDVQQKKIEELLNFWQLETAVVESVEQEIAWLEEHHMSLP